MKSWTVLKPTISSSDRVRVLLLSLDWNDWCSYVCFKSCQLLIMIMFLFLEMLKAQFNISLPTKKCLYKVEIRKFYVIGWYAIINSNIYQVKEKKHNIYRFWGWENKSDRSCLNVRVMMPLDNLFPVSAQSGELRDCHL